MLSVYEFDPWYSEWGKIQLLLNFALYSEFDGTALMILGHVTRLGGKTSVITFQNEVELIILIKRF